MATLSRCERRWLLAFDALQATWCRGRRGPGCFDLAMRASWPSKPVPQLSLHGYPANGRMGDRLYCPSTKRSSRLGGGEELGGGAWTEAPADLIRCWRMVCRWPEASDSRSICAESLAE